jgi:hypothetical protein
MRPLRGKGRPVILWALFFSALLLNTHNNDFTIGYHSDEPKKVRFIETNTQNFKHPILMLQVVRAVNFFAGFTGAQAVAVLGRTITAVFGASIVLLSYLISRTALGRSYACVVAGLAATSPILVIHSHYLKEDIILTFFCLLSLLLFFRFIQVPNLTSIVGLGVSTGLAVSSHYKGVLLFIIYLAGPILVPVKDGYRYFRGILVCTVIATSSFLAVNYPMLLHPRTFKKGVSFELRHILEGHGPTNYTVKIHATSELFGFHLVNSIVPGMTLLVTLFALSFLVHALVKWEKSFWQDKVLVFYALLFYFAVELSPAKPFPDFMRYVIPVVPVALYFSVRSVGAVSGYLQFRWPRMAFVTFVVASFSLPLYESVRLVHDLGDDTRGKAEQWVADNHWKAKFEAYAGLHADVRSLSTLDIPAERNKGVTHLVASSFMYDRFIYGNRLKSQAEGVYEAYRKYEELFDYPFTEIAPPYKSFAFSNPTIRIIDIRRLGQREGERGREYSPSRQGTGG